MTELIPLAPDHLDTINDMVRREGKHDHHPWILAREELAEMFDEPHFVPSQDGRIALLDGQPAGWCRVWHQPSGVRLEKAHLMGTVDPPHRGRGVGAALLEWQIGRARERLLDSSPSLPRFIRTNVFEWVTGATRLFERHGMTPVRWFDEMSRPLGGIGKPPTVEGVDIRAWEASDTARVLPVKNATFEDHWGSTPTDPAVWESRIKGYGTRLDLSFVARAGSEIIGFALNGYYPEGEERREGWIDTLGVLREWRGRGVASALIGASLAAFSRADFTHAALGVDSDNPTGAAGLYRRLGFTSAFRSVCHQIEL